MCYPQANSGTHFPVTKDHCLGKAEGIFSGIGGFRTGELKKPDKSSHLFKPAPIGGDGGSA
jgi:hypothetical protein